MKSFIKNLGIAVLGLGLLLGSFHTVLAKSDYYMNSLGQKVHSPVESMSVPRGASAQCRDKTYSFSKSRKGTCSGHKGVLKWLK
jgi:hypothetical protein